MELTETALKNLLKTIHRAHGYDFFGYSTASLIRRINRFVLQQPFANWQELEEKLARDEAFFELFVQEITVNVTELFRDPSFYLALRKEVTPALKTYPFVKVWDAGCSTGEETYSLAIWLREERLLPQSRIYATDINQRVLAKAKEGIYHLTPMKTYSQNYFKAGGKHSLSDYYRADYDRALFDSSLKKNLVFAVHNLVSDTSFNEFNLIVCRNVLIYFKKELQEKVFKLFFDSLVMFGFLALGSKESLTLSGYRDKFEVIDSKERIYRKISH